MTILPCCRPRHGTPLFLQVRNAGRWCAQCPQTLGPDLRLAFIASDADTSAALRLRLNAGSQWVSHLLRDLTLACLTDEAFIASMTETRRHYRQQNEKLAAALARHGHSHATPGDGLNSGCRCQRQSQPYALRLARAGWLVREGKYLVSERLRTGCACRWAV